MLARPNLYGRLQIQDASDNAQEQEAADLTPTWRGNVKLQAKSGLAVKSLKPILPVCEDPEPAL
jgi:hypothetical protein